MPPNPQPRLPLSMLRQAEAAEAGITQARADVAHAEAEVRFQTALLEKAKVFWNYTRIESPYDGVVTSRKFHRGDFIRSADQGGLVPLLTVARTDRMRVVVQVADRDVPYTSVGDEATIKVDVLPGKDFHGKVARFADVLDPKSRTMRVEIDLANENDFLREGMSCLPTITLDSESKAMSVPASALVGKTDKGSGTVYVVRDGLARLVPVLLGQDDGRSMEILSGLLSTDQVVVRHTGAIGEGIPVSVSVTTAAAPTSPAPAALSRAVHSSFLFDDQSGSCRNEWSDSRIAQEPLRRDGDDARLDRDRRVECAADSDRHSAGVQEPGGAGADVLRRHAGRQHRERHHQPHGALDRPGRGHGAARNRVRSSAPASSATTFAATSIPAGR